MMQHMVNHLIASIQVAINSLPLSMRPSTPNMEWIQICSSMVAIFIYLTSGEECIPLSMVTSQDPNCSIIIGKYRHYGDLVEKIIQNMNNQDGHIFTDTEPVPSIGKRLNFFNIRGLVYPANMKQLSSGPMMKQPMNKENLISLFKNNSGMFKPLEEILRVPSPPKRTPPPHKYNNKKRYS